MQKIIDKSPFLTKVYEILDLYGSRRMGRSAAAFAYYLMLSFFPLLICVASIIGRTRIDTGELLELLSEVIPPQVTETLVTFFGYIHDNYSQAMLWAGIILLFTAASGAFGTIMATMGDLYGQQRYQGLLHTVMCFLYSAVFLVIIYLSVVVVATGDWFIDLLDQWFHVGEIIASWTWLRFILLTGIIMLLLLLILFYLTVQGANYPSAFLSSMLFAGPAGRHLWRAGHFGGQHPFLHHDQCLGAVYAGIRVTGLAYYFDALAASHRDHHPAGRPCQ